MHSAWDVILQEHGELCSQGFIQFVDQKGSYFAEIFVILCLLQLSSACMSKALISCQITTEVHNFQSCMTFPLYFSSRTLDISSIVLLMPQIFNNLEENPA